jgi:putative ABC transport system ATP-binding protein
MAIFQALNRRGITIVLVTHDRDVADHAGRLLAFRDGALVGDEPAAAARQPVP